MNPEELSALRRELERAQKAASGGSWERWVRWIPGLAALLALGGFYTTTISSHEDLKHHVGKGDIHQSEAEKRLLIQKEIAVMKSQLETILIEQRVSQQQQGQIQLDLREVKDDLIEVKKKLSDST